MAKSKGFSVALWAERSHLTLNSQTPMTQILHPSHTLEALSANLRAQNILGWQHTRQVAYLHRHPELTSTCLYHWDHQRKQPVPTASQQLCFNLEDIYCEVRGEFNSKKLVVDMDLGLDGKLRLITGLSTQAATSLLASLSALSPTLLIGSIELRVKPGTIQGVVLLGTVAQTDQCSAHPFITHTSDA